MATIAVKVNPVKEIYEIASDFANPVEVLREGLHNSYDAGAQRVAITRVPRRSLTDVAFSRWISKTMGSE